MVFHLLSQLSYRIVCGGRDMIECPPVIRNEVPRVESLKQRKRVRAGQMAVPESHLPRRCIANRKQRHVKPAVSKCPYNHTGRVIPKRRITREKDTLPI